MTIKERVLRAIEFRKPDRIPICNQIDHDNTYNIEIDEKIQARYEGDILVISESNPDFIRGEDGRDEWGCVWSSFGETMGEVIGNPLKDWEEFDEFAKNIPNYRNPRRYELVRKKRKENPDKFLLGGLGFMMMDIINFRGYEEYMVDLCLEQDNLSRLIDLIYKTAYEKIDMYAECGVDGIIAWEDWGLQDRLMMSPNVWRELFKKPMQDMIAYIHKKNMKYLLHCCGFIKDIIGDFIEMGIDVLQLDQQLNMGLDYLSTYKGKICFMCPADIQMVSDNKNFKDIEVYCKAMAEALATPEGGFMYKTYSQPLAIHSYLETVETECRAFRSFNPYAVVKCSKNPIIAGKGICDPHLHLFENRVYLYTSHDKSSDNTDYAMNDWTVWSTEDFVVWKQENIIRPEDFYMGASEHCWAVDAAFANGKYYYYYSNENRQVGIAVGEHPWGPFVDCKTSPLLDGTLTLTREYDPAVFEDKDGSFYIIFGGPAWAYGEGAGYFIAKLKKNMYELAEKPRRLELNHEGDDKASLNRIGDTYYLSYGSCYATSDNVYGPYRYRGNTGASEDHGSYLEWNNQLFNSFTIFDPSMYYRSSGICYVHQKMNGELVVDSLIVEYGVGQYDANWNKIEAEWYMKLEGRAKKVENPRYGFDVEVDRTDEEEPGVLYYPNIRNIRDKSGMAFFASCDCPEGAEIEVRKIDEGTKTKLTVCNIGSKGRHSWRSFYMYTCQIPEFGEKQLNLELVIRVKGNGSCRLDYFKFYREYEK